jgi:hypothetical protein
MKQFKKVRKVCGNENFLWLSSILSCIKLQSYRAVGIAPDQLEIFIQVFLVSLLLKNMLRLDELGLAQVPETFSVVSHRFLSITLLAFKAVMQLHEAIGAPYALSLGDLFNGRLFQHLLQQTFASPDPSAFIQSRLGASGDILTTLLKVVQSCCDIKSLEPLRTEVLSREQESNPNCMNQEALWVHTVLHLDKSDQPDVRTVSIEDHMIRNRTYISIPNSRWNHVIPNAHTEPLVPILSTPDSSLQVPPPSPHFYRNTSERSHEEARRLRAYAEELAPRGQVKQAFQLDDFQRAAAECIELRNESVLVCAPTGAGKTYVHFQSLAGSFV